MRDTFILVGLGNPGDDYAFTRHNVGFMVIDRLKDKVFMQSHRKGRYYWMGQGRIGEKEVRLIKPLTYMNCSGEAMVRIKKNYGLDLSRLIVVCDDINLPLGRIRIRRKGGDGGHNGLRSIIYSLGSEDFMRVRIGIGRPDLYSPVLKYVLSPFTVEEKSLIDKAMDLAVEAIQVVIQEGIEVGMDRFN